MADMTIMIGSGEKDHMADTRQPAKTAWKEDVHDLLTEALRILKNEADEDVKPIVDSLDMALKTLAFDPKQTKPEDDADVSGIMDAKKKSDKKSALDFGGDE